MIRGAKHHYAKRFIPFIRGHLSILVKALYTGEFSIYRYSFIAVADTHNQLAIPFLYVVERNKRNLSRSPPHAWINDDTIIAEALLVIPSVPLRF